MLEFSKTKLSFWLVGVVVVHAVISLCNAVLTLVWSSVFSDWYNWTYWSLGGQVFLLLSLHVVFCAIFRVWVLGWMCRSCGSCFTLFVNCYTSFAFRKPVFFHFYAFLGCLCFAYILISMAKFFFFVFFLSLLGLGGVVAWLLYFELACAALRE